MLALFAVALGASEVRSAPSRTSRASHPHPSTRTQSQKHYHGGSLQKYDVGPPALMLSASDESRLRSGRSVLQTITSEDGASQRMIMVQDIQVPSQIVLG